VGIKQLVLALEDKSVTVRPDEVMLLLSGGDNLKLTLENVAKHKEPCSFYATYIRTVLQHILLCIQCNKYLKKFIGILERCLSGGGDPLKDCEEISCELVLNNGIPCNRYVIDGEFDQMREIAYNAIQTQYCLEQDLHEIVDNFIKDYYK
jgi:hypothetical protein